MATPVDDHDDELRIFQAAALLGVPSRDVYELIERGELQAYRRDRRIVIPKRAVERLRAQ